jgi:hypothetical protein
MWIKCNGCNTLKINKLHGGGCSPLLTRLYQEKFPLTGKFTGNFGSVSGPDRVYSRVNTGVRGFQLEIVTGNEQGNNRRDNREKCGENRDIIARP